MTSEGKSARETLIAHGESCENCGIFEGCVDNFLLPLIERESRLSIAELADSFPVLWEQYALAADDALTPDAIVLKQQLLKIGAHFAEHDREMQESLEKALLTLRQTLVHRRGHA